MNKNTLKAIARRIHSKEVDFKIGTTEYHANYERGTILYYLPYFIGGPQIVYFDELPEI